MLAGLEHTEIKTDLIPRVEDNRPNSARDVVERHRVAVAEDRGQDLDREEHHRHVRCETVSRGGGESGGGTY